MRYNRLAVVTYSASPTTALTMPLPALRRADRDGGQRRQMDRCAIGRVPRLPRSV